MTMEIVSLNQSIDRLTNQGQKFIENHLERFHITDAGAPLSIASDGKTIPSLKDIN